MTNLSSLQVILQTFMENNSAVKAAAVIRPDGSPLATTMRDQLLSENSETILAAILALNNQMDGQRAKSNIELVTVLDARGYLICSNCGDAMLLTLFSENTNSGFWLTEIKRITEEVICILNPAVILSSFLSLPKNRANIPSVV